MAIARRRSPAMARLKDELTRRKADLRFYRQRAKSATPVIVDAGITMAGGAAAGYVQTSQMARIAGIQTELVLGAALVGYGALSAGKTGNRGYDSKIPEYACSLGKGMLAVYAAQMIQEFQMRQLAASQEG
tara:strand:- start:2841 stop:3233 length:393 start_codon:yes stop_codon:yes gene_type:complete